MDFFEKFQWLFMIIAMFVGLGLGQIGNVAVAAAYFITPFLMMMLFGIFLQTPVESLKEGFKNAKVLRLSLLINFVWTPLLAFGLSFLFFRNTPDVFIALIMDMVTPCTDWYLVFTGISGGSIALSTSFLPWNLFMQFISIPVAIFLFAGTVVEIQPYIFLESFLRVLLLPFIIAVITRNIIYYIKGQSWFEQNTLGRIGVFQSLFLMFAIMAMFASQGVILIENLSLVIGLIIPVILFFIINFSVGQLIGRIFRLSYQEGASLIFTILARNAPLALTIAVATFPERPLIPLVLAVESLIELPMLFAFSQLMLLFYSKRWWSNLA
ncbi:arsenic resistance protein [Clostridium formicaceticum]|uniref:Arsenic resistance protein n=1 Tax=Clostridium formicaceticum TaxID=1497 RepID=A0AAC9RPU3_9CLOT|nr:bile acid:sodium symporter [Clostridium formicaceticum]AOY75055.1 arsenic resistance protein [Clostridium formicaceticum]ARE89477.1 Sodium Bile acid symporter family protein [Clostridium formicaceticum]